MRLLLVLSIAALASCGGRHAVRQVIDVPSTPIVDTPPKPDRPALVLVSVAKQAAVQDEPAPATDPEPPPKVSLSDLVSGVNARLRDVFFAYDSFTLDTAATNALEFNHSVLRPLLSDFPKLEVVIEGHCDERGSAEYNLGLGDFRAKRALDFLSQLGIANANLRPVSYGREKPRCSEPSEACWSRNRRAHLFVDAPR